MKKAKDLIGDNSIDRRRALLALGGDSLPNGEDLASLRLPLRGVLLHHLGGRGLKSWEMLGELGRLAAPKP